MSRHPVRDTMDKEGTAFALILAVIFLFGGSCQGFGKGCGTPVAVQMIHGTQTSTTGGQ